MVAPLVQHEFMHAMFQNDLKFRQNLPLTQKIWRENTEYSALKRERNLLTDRDSLNSEQAARLAEIRAQLANSHISEREIDLAYESENELIADLLPLFMSGDREIVDLPLGTQERSFNIKVPANQFEFDAHGGPFPSRYSIAESNRDCLTQDLAARKVCFENAYQKIISIIENQMSLNQVQLLKLNTRLMYEFEETPTFN